MKEPHGLSNYIAAVLKMESSTFCRVLGDASKVVSKQQNGGGNNNAHSRGYYHNNQKAAVLDVKPQKENVPPSRPSQGPRQRHSDAELDAIRRQGFGLNVGINGLKCMKKSVLSRNSGCLWLSMDLNWSCWIMKMSWRRSYLRSCYVLS